MSEEAHVSPVKNDYALRRIDTDSDIEKLDTQSPPRLVEVVSNVLKNTVSRKTLNDPGPPPDGGSTAWIVLVLAHLINLITWGLFNAFGVLQTYYVQELQLPPSNISWIGSIQGFLLFFVCTFSGRLSDAGYFRQTFGIGSILMLLGIFGASASTTYWQLILSQGICLGLGGGLCYCPAISIAATYFSKKQPLALGIVASGSSTGGLIFGAILQQLLPRIGYAWTMRVMGFFILVTLVLGNLFIKPRRLIKSQGPMVEWAAFKDPVYAYFAFGMFFIFLGTYIPVFYVRDRTS
jgi:MFS family permease